MSQTKEGALLSKATRAGITVADYIARVNAGKKRCTKCKTWKDVSCFGKDSSREDGISWTCIDCRHVKERKSTKGRVSTFKGKTHTEENKQKYRELHKGNQYRLGKKHTPEAKAKISVGLRKSAARGEKCHSYKDGKLVERRGERFSTAYKRWRFDVFTRDNFTCQNCGDSRGGNLVAHHLKGFADFPELRYEVSNGLTVCDPCHKARHAKEGY